MKIDQLSNEDTQKYINLLKDYISVLNKELSETSSLAYIKGWKSTRVKEGEEIRKKLNVYDESFQGSKSKWKRYRFCTNSIPDYRPLIFNEKYPWWCSGTGSNYAVIVCYLPYDEDLFKYWNDAHDINVTEEDEIIFSDRFPEPDYFIKS